MLLRPSPRHTVCVKGSPTSILMTTLALSRCTSSESKDSGGVEVFSDNTLDRYRSRNGPTTNTRRGNSQNSVFRDPPSPDLTGLDGHDVARLVPPPRRHGTRRVPRRMA